MFTKGDKIKIIGNHAFLSIDDVRDDIIGHKGTIIEPQVGYEDDEYNDYELRPYWVKVQYHGSIREIIVKQKDMKKVWL